FDEIHHALSALRAFAGKAHELGPRRERLQEIRAADSEAASRYSGARAAPGNRVEVLRMCQREIPLGGALHDGARDRMLCIALHRGGKAQRLVLSEIS